MQDGVETGTTNTADTRSEPTIGNSVRVGRRLQEKRPPEIQVQKRDGRIESIVVTCSCGEQVTLMCDYDEGSE